MMLLDVISTMLALLVTSISFLVCAIIAIAEIRYRKTNPDPDPLTNIVTWLIFVVYGGLGIYLTLTLLRVVI